MPGRNLGRNTDDGSVKTIPVGGMPHGLTVWPQPGRYSLGHTGNMRWAALAPRLSALALLHLREEIEGAREIDLAGVRLDVEQLDDAVGDQH